MNPTKEQLEKINLYTRRTLTADEIFVFKVRLCDTNIDKDYEKFTLNSLFALSKLYIGKSGVFDNTNINISARIFETTVHKLFDNVDSSFYAYLEASAYMIRSESNKDIIREIEAGIKKEVSVGCAVDKTICSICGHDIKTNPCEHKKGMQYAVHGFNGKKYATCHYILENPTDAYEWSFVAVPVAKRGNSCMWTILVDTLSCYDNKSIIVTIDNNSFVFYGNDTQDAINQIIERTCIINDGKLKAIFNIDINCHGNGLLIYDIMKQMGIEVNQVYTKGVKYYLPKRIEMKKVVETKYVPKELEP